MGNATQLTATLQLTSELTDVPGEIVIARPGLVKTTKGNFLLDEQAAGLVLGNMQARGTDIVIDYEHHTVGGEFAAPDGLARAAGWIKQLAFDAVRGLVAKVEWTPRAKELLANREYRYLSPWLDYRLSDGRAFRLNTVSLVNRPATIDAVPVVAKDDTARGRGGEGEKDHGSSASDCPGVPVNSASLDTRKDRAMKDRLIGVLALKADASEEDIICAVRSAQEKAGSIVAAENKANTATQTLSLVCKAAGISETEPAKIEAAAMVLAEKAGKHDELVGERDRLRGELVGKEADTLIAAAKKEGKLVEAQEPWARELILKDRSQFEAWAKTAPVVRPQGETRAPAGTAGGESRDRASIIASARKEYAELDPAYQVLTSERGFVDEALRGKQQGETTAEEVKTLALKES